MSRKGSRSPWEWLTTPPVDQEHQAQARLLAILIVVVAPLGVLLGLLRALATTGPLLQDGVLLAALLGSSSWFIAYLLLRLGHFRVAVWIVLLAASGAVVVASTVAPAVHLRSLLFPIIISGFLLSTVAGLVYVILNLLGVLLIPLYFWRLPPGDVLGSVITLLGLRHKEQLAANRRRELLVRDHRYRRATRAAHAVVWEIDLDSGDFYTDRYLAHLLGYTPEELPNSIEVWNHLAHPDDLPRVVAQFESFMAGKDVRFEPEYRLLHRDGSIRWFRTHAEVVEEDGARRLVGTSLDITARREAELALRRRNRELDLLHRITATATTTRALDAGATLDRVCRELAHTFGVPYCGLALLDETAETLQFIAAFTEAESVIDLPQSIRVAVNPIAKEILQAHSPIVTGNALEDARFASIRDLIERTNGVSFLSLPLRTDSGAAGMVALVSPRRNHFTPPDVALAAAAAGAASQVLEKALLLQRVEQQTQRLSALHEINRAISSSLEPARVYEAIVRRASELIPADRISLLLWNSEANGYERLGLWQAHKEDDVRQNLLHLMPPPDQLRALGVRAIADIKQDPRVPPEERQQLDVRAALIVPLQFQDRVGGALSFVLYDDPHTWTVAECMVAELLAAHAAVAVANARRHAATAHEVETVNQIVYSVGEGLVLLDARQRVVLANPQARRYLTLLGHASDKPLTEVGGISLKALAATSEQAEREELVVQAPEKHILEVAVHLLHSGPWSGGCVLTLRDVTEIREQQRHLQEQQRLATVGQLAAGIAHDFNNILAAIVLYAQMLSNAHLPPPAVRHAEAIYEQAQRASALVRQILDFSRRSVIQRRDVDLARLLAEQANLLERILPETIELALDCAAEATVVHADPGRIQQAIMNLALNARDAMPGGGRLVFRLTTETAERDLPLPQMQPGEWVHLTVSDTGEGIPEAVRPRVFEPFFTTKPPGKGSGLGLAQVHGIVHQHDGAIALESAVGIGTTIHIYLPRSEEHGEVREAAPGR